MIKRGKSAEDGQEKVLVASQWKLVRWKFARHKIAMFSTGVLMLLYFVALFAGFFAPYDPYRYDVNYVHAPPARLRLVDAEGRFHLRPFTYHVVQSMHPETFRIRYEEDTTRKLPLRFFVRGDSYTLFGVFESDLHFFGFEGGRAFLFGADELGRDLLSRTFYGSQISLSIGLVGIAVSFFLGIIIGGVSGYVGGRVDMVIQRTIEFIQSIPTLPLWMALSAALPPHWTIPQVYFAIVIILSLVGWTTLARVVRGKFMALREEDFVMIARLHGAGQGRIIFKHLLPSFYSYIIASLTLSVPAMILGETALSFIGLGMQAPAISWGVLLRESQAISVLANAPWLLIPGLYVIVVVLAFNFAGDGLRDAADPYAAI